MKILKTITTLSIGFGLTFASSLSFAKSDWIPTFDDDPVPQYLTDGIQKALPERALVRPARERKVLILSATSGYRHGSIPVGKQALEMLGNQTGAYKSVISDDPVNFEADALRTFDAVILLSPTQDFFMPDRKKRDQFSEDEWEWLRARHKRLIDNLIEYVKAGGGLMGIHSATDACYGHKEYGEAIGGYFNGHPWTWESNVTIVVEDPEHSTMKPVFEAVEDFQLVEEIYQFREEPYSRDRVRVLLRLDPERSDPVEKTNRDDNDFPVAWVQEVGEGRVFYTSIGHNNHIFTNPLMLKHYLAGIQFAIGDLDGEMTPSAER